ncbi:MAG: DNA recombination protein RmuC [Flavobacteriales bacterium]
MSNLLIFCIVLAVVLLFVSVILVLKLNQNQKDKTALQLVSDDLQNQLKSSLEKLKHVEEKNRSLDTEIQLKSQEFNTLKTLFSQDTEKLKQLNLQNEELKLKAQELKLKQEDLQAQKQEMQSQLTQYFEQLSQKIFKERDKEWRDQNQKNLHDILNPFKEKLNEFEKSVQTQRAENNKLSGELKGELNQLNQLNKNLSKEAQALATALKGENKTQGNWGEYRLERLLEFAGLKEEVHYNKQDYYNDDEGRKKSPDFIINLPDNKHLIIDSKVSLSAYERYFSATNETEKELALKAHLTSIKNHIKDLSSKNYDQLPTLQTVDYVLMFVAVEPALFLAVDHDGNLFDFALKNNIVLVSHTTLLATLRTISHIWRQEDQKKNIQEITNQAEGILNQLDGFVTLVDKIGSQIETVKKTQEQIQVKLQGRQGLISKSEKMKSLGLNTKK